MSYTRPEPTTLPPDIRPVNLNPPQKKNKCLYCGSRFDLELSKCPSCGAPIEE